MMALRASLAALLYGGPRPRSGIAGRLAGARVFLPIAGIPLIFGLAIVLLLQVVDPLDLRPWGLPPKFADANYPGLQTVYFMAARTREPHDLVVFGGSTTMAVTPAQLRKVFGAKTPVNLSYPLPSPDDSARILTQLLETPGLRRVILGVDHSQMGNDGAPFLTGVLAMQMFDARWFDMPDFNPRMIEAAIRRASGKPLDTPTWRIEPASYYDAPRLPTQPDLIATLNDAVSHPAPDLFLNPRLPDCRSYRFITRLLVPIGRAARKKGLRIDLMFPPIPFATFYSWQKKPIMMSFWTRGSDYRQLAHFHACIAQVVTEEKLSTIRVHAIDTDAALTGDPLNYRDTVHLTAPAALERLLTDVRDDRFLLTRSNLDDYSQAIETRVRDAGRQRYGKN
jgi:hypothetical protein